MRYVCAVAVTLVCLAALSGGALASDSWSLVSQDLPATIEWDAIAPGNTVTAHNDGTTDWTTTYGLASVRGTGETASYVNRWGRNVMQIVGVTVPPESDYTFDFELRGPPITTLRYAGVLTPTSVAVDDPLDCNWMMGNPVTPYLTLIPTDTAVQAVTVSRFPDIQPGTAGGWARTYVEECAGRVPLIVGGYPDGTYGPSLAVTRDQMAVFMQRALELPLGTYADEFSDVIHPFWAESQIQSCVDNGIVGGYPDGTYRPFAVVNRDAMAVFVARGMAGGESGVPTGPVTGSFPDVAPSYWAYDHIEYAHAHNVVGGYPDGNYYPLLPVSRDQMSVFVYRGFMQPTGVPVVIAGPDFTGENLNEIIEDVLPGNASHYGWSSAGSGEAGMPLWVYVQFDAARLHSDLAEKVGGNWRVAARILGIGGSIWWQGTVDISGEGCCIDEARAACAATGVPYFTVCWEIDTTGWVAANYTLVYTVGDRAGHHHDLPRQPVFTITE